MEIILGIFLVNIFLPSHGAALPINRVGVDALRCDVMLNMFCEKKMLFSSDCLFSFRWCPSLWFDGGYLQTVSNFQLWYFSFLLLSSGLLVTEFRSSTSWMTNFWTIPVIYWSSFCWILTEFWRGAGNLFLIWLGWVVFWITFFYISVVFFYR